MIRVLALSLLLPAAARAQGFDIPVVEEKIFSQPKDSKGTAPADPDETIRAGFAVETAGAGPTVGQVLPDSPADELGLLSGDSLWYLNGRRIASREDAAEALAAWTPGTRLSAVVGRAHRIVPLASPPLERKPARARASGSLTLREKVLRSKRLKSAAKRPPAELKAPGFIIEKGETIWIRFPKGLPRSVERGMIVMGETATSLTSDDKLDFAIIPQNSKVWAQVISESSEGRLRSVRLHVHKIQLAGGRTYACSGLIDEVSGDRSRLRASPGGTIAAALGAEDKLIADSSRRFRMRFLKPFTITEPAGYYQAGPGLWIKSVGRAKKKAFEITHIIPERSAEHAGLEVGDRIFRIDGTWAIRLDFSSALGKLYGPPGSKLELRVIRKMGNEIERVTLRRGIRYDKATKEPIPLRPPTRSSVLIR